MPVTEAAPQQLVVVRQARQLGHFAGDIVRRSAERRHKLCFVTPCLVRASAGFSGVIRLRYAQAQAIRL